MLGELNVEVMTRPRAGCSAPTAVTGLDVAERVTVAALASGRADCACA